MAEKGISRVRPLVYLPLFCNQFAIAEKKEEMQLYIGTLLLFYDIFTKIVNNDCPLSLNCSLTDTTDDIFLTEEIEDNDGYHRENQHRHKAAEIGLSVCTRHRKLNGDGYGAPVASQNQIGEQIVVPDPHGVQHAHRYDGRGEKGKGYGKEGAHA